ncbi:MBOAT family O-acyltransferase [Butyrivibrio sp. M55]|uniref:MBOAT family O-acyltransferase n=1 Tax=Butyrivibrio sp. M55 TaxID=1855323 RepID=UPI0008EBECC7|nr:MBOAT family O-acyltransferase [Butyrivibrio sp. M55]SFU85098.1 D-alanyl-lipoteichoic acid acyltransferase DltB, MBOAT superfamily [Butyrivibrio sp. M55]
MLFNTPQFVIMLLSLIVIWYVIPSYSKKIFLLIVDYYFSYSLGGFGTLVALLLVTSFTYFAGIILEKTTKKKQCLLMSVAALVALLIYSKYVGLVNGIFEKTSGTTLYVITMIGVSYYVFSSISYLVDIYINRDCSDYNFLNVALWLSFFTKIIAGPIERHAALAKQFKNINNLTFEFETVKKGLLICAYGYFYKMIIADRIGLFVDAVYGNIDSQYGLTLFITMVLYSLQIYFDFAGYSFIAYGASYAMGIRISRNFEQPYFSSSVSEFWKKWHISLSSWLRDYIYIPLGGNRKGKFRQYFNIIITFLISGAWHGAGLTYIMWGALHGVYQVIEKSLNIRRKLSASISTAITFICVSFAWIFFRADSISDAIRFIFQMFRWNPWILTDGTLVSFGMDILDWGVIIVSVSLAFLIEYKKNHGFSIYRYVMSKNIIVRWLFYYLVIVLLMIMGKYGAIYDATNFIYYKY